MRGISLFQMNKIISINPATEEVLGEIPVSTEEEVNDAVKKAKKAFLSWKKIPYEEKYSLFKNILNDLETKKDFFAELITKEMGKPIQEAESEVEYTLDRIKSFIEKVKDFTKPEKINENTSLYFEPIGVVGAITPWNFPFSLPIWPIVPSLLIGNTVVFKPSELTTLVNKEEIEIFMKHLPEGVLNLVIGADETGKALVKADINMVSFVGSTAAGKDIMKSCSEKLKKVVLELGGKDPAVVLEDANLDHTAEAIVHGSLRNCGQVCCSIERVYAMKDIADKLTEKIVEKAKIKVGNGLENPDMGPLVSRQQFENFISHIEDAKQKGAKILLGGKKIEGKGYFYEPTVLTNVNNEMKIMTEETFGPAIPIQAVESEEEAIKSANALPYGLTASVWTKNIEKGERISRELEAGSVGINQTAASIDEAPWGGVKQSGLGRTLSKYGIREFTEMKVVMVNK